MPNGTGSGAYPVQLGTIVGGGIQRQHWSTDNRAIMRVGDLGEQGLLQLIAPFCTEQMGDDCALMGATRSGYELAISTDMLVEGVHFSPQTTSAYDVGWRGATANLSDLAAVGAEPWGLTVGLGLPADTAVEWVVGVYQGLADCAGRWGVGVVGGDLVRSPVPVLGITAFGQVPCGKAIRRDRAQVGDQIVVTGLHGLSRAGLALLLQPELTELVSKEEAEVLRRAHQRPVPRLDIAQWLMHKLPALERPLAGMDSSDGLADAIWQICTASGVGAAIDKDKIKVSPAIVKLAGENARNWVLYGGEDFELVLCLPADTAVQLSQHFPDCDIVGEIVTVSDPANNLNWLASGSAFCHFIT
ncbi:MAG: thiamine-phosphate kinase [Pseudanabaenaceae cyanobacterium]